MGGAPDTNSITPLQMGKGQESSIQFAPQQKWDIQSSHPEALWNGIAQGVSNLAGGVTAAYGGAGGLGKDATSQAASAGKTGPVADMSNTPQVASIKKYMADPSLSNFMDTEYPTAFKFNQY